MLRVMTTAGDTVHIRQATANDLPLLTSWTSDDSVAWVTGERLSAELATGNYRPEWSWIAEQDGHPIARALWWGPADSDRPVTLDCLSTVTGLRSPETVGASLIRAGLDAFGPGPALEFNVDVGPTQADSAGSHRALRWREETARAGGFSRTTQRVSFARTSTDPLPPRPTRLRFVAASDEVFHDLFAEVARGTLDAHSLSVAAEQGLAALADQDLTFYLSLPGERGAWRIAELDDGTTIGFIIPTRTAYDASISYLGVLPDHRGQGYVHELLAQMVRHHHDNGQKRIVGTTDAANHPMRSAFEQASFTVTRMRTVHSQ